MRETEAQRRRGETARWSAVYGSELESRRRRSLMRRKLTKLGVDREPRCAAVLDLCCGHGETLDTMYALGFRDLTGLDLRIAPEQALDPRFTLLEGDARQTGLASESLDVVTCLHALHHLTTPAKIASLLAEAQRLLRPGGKLFLMDFEDSLRLRATLWLVRTNRFWPCLPALANQSVLLQEEWPFLSRYLDHWREIRAMLESSGLHATEVRRSAFYFFTTLVKAG